MKIRRIPNTIENVSNFVLHFSITFICFRNIIKFIYMTCIIHCDRPCGSSGRLTQYIHALCCRPNDGNETRYKNVADIRWKLIHTDRWVCSRLSLSMQTNNRLNSQIDIHNQTRQTISYESIGNFLNACVILYFVVAYCRFDVIAVMRMYGFAVQWYQMCVCESLSLPLDQQYQRHIEHSIGNWRSYLSSPT